jgi:uncharacterized radical SAM superfamily Fe-S cluster-containing enzyme
MMTERQQMALTRLNQITQQPYFYLGEGASSVIFHNGESVFKIFLLENLEALSYKKEMLYSLKGKIHRFDNSDFFYPIIDLIQSDANTIILIYPYEESLPCSDFTYEEMEHFLAECWQRRIIFQDIKPENCIRVDGKLKWIDYEPDKFTDNLFLNMAVRAFIFCKYAQTNDLAFINKLCRSAINQFYLPELSGLASFLNRVFARVIYKESQASRIAFNDMGSVFMDTWESVLSTIKSTDLSLNNWFSIAYNEHINPDKLFFQLLANDFYLNQIQIGEISLNEQNHFEPNQLYFQIQSLSLPSQPVSLVIKACVQDSAVLYEAVKHIIRQTASPDKFDEKILALDTKTADFLREYNNDGTWEKLLQESQRLLSERIIDKVIYPPDNEVLTINKRWFDIPTSYTHTTQGVPIASQLYAFEQAKNDYILQVDCDAMIGRRNHQHSFLGDMLKALKENESVISVGFNIYKSDNEGFTPYFGFEGGGFVPEVRFCLLNRKRLLNLLPLPNQMTDKGLQLSWYRALEQKQKATGKCSIRGGHSDSFFIHPPNFKKTNQDVWFTQVDRVEQGIIPDCQLNDFDLAGSYYDWANPKRNEPLVVVSCFRNISLARFLRFWYSMISQSLDNWGWILIDDASENGLAEYIKHLIKPYQDKITFISNKFPIGVAANTYKAIHYFMQNQDSIVAIVDGDDAMIGKNALKNVYEKYTYWGADMVIGKMYRTDKLTAHYKYNPNFVNPRLYGGNVWQHLRSFKKYLFDSLSFEDMKIQNKQANWEAGVLLSKKFSKKWIFPEYCWDYAYMIPITEMATNPMIINHFNYFHDRTSPSNPSIRALKDAEIAEILQKPHKTPKVAFKGRKTFLPNLQKIEIDITYACNLKCINCNRSSTQAPTDIGMNLRQIENFINESIELDKKWELINLLGGEPTIHPDFQAIVNKILNDYINAFSPQTILQITSNGFGDLVQTRLNELPKHSQLVIDYASFKEDKTVLYFSPFNDAPIDNIQLNQTEYHKGCWVTSYCGIGLNQLGYYPCGVAGGIDRVFELNLGVKQLKDVDESIQKLLDTFCRYCGNFSDYAVNQGNFIPRNEKASLKKPIISETWKKQYKIYNGK